MFQSLTSCQLSAPIGEAVAAIMAVTDGPMQGFLGHTDEEVLSPDSVRGKTLPAGNMSVDISPRRCGFFHALLRSHFRGQGLVHLCVRKVHRRAYSESCDHWLVLVPSRLSGAVYRKEMPVVVTILVAVAFFFVVTLVETSCVSPSSRCPLASGSLAATACGSSGRGQRRSV